MMWRSPAGSKTALKLHGSLQKISRQPGAADAAGHARGAGRRQAGSQAVESSDVLPLGAVTA